MASLHDNSIPKFIFLSVLVRFSFHFKFLLPYMLFLDHFLKPDWQVNIYMFPLYLKESILCTDGSEDGAKSEPSEDEKLETVTEISETISNSNGETDSSSPKESTTKGLYR